MARLGGYKYYLNQDDMMTVHRVSDDYAFHTQSEFLSEVGLRTWTEVKKQKLIYGDKTELEGR